MQKLTAKLTLTTVALTIIHIALLHVVTVETRKVTNVHILNYKPLQDV